MVTDCARFAEVELRAYPRLSTPTVVGVDGTSLATARALAWAADLDARIIT
jgi:hypothetical protein